MASFIGVGVALLRCSTRYLWLHHFQLHPRRTVIAPSVVGRWMPLSQQLNSDRHHRESDLPWPRIGSNQTRQEQEKGKRRPLRQIPRADKLISCVLKPRKWSQLHRISRVGLMPITWVWRWDVLPWQIDGVGVVISFIVIHTFLHHQIKLANLAYKRDKGKTKQKKKSISQVMAMCLGYQQISTQGKYHSWQVNTLGASTAG